MIECYLSELLKICALKNLPCPQNFWLHACFNTKVSKDGENNFFPTLKQKHLLAKTRFDSYAKTQVVHLCLCFVILCYIYFIIINLSLFLIDLLVKLALCYVIFCEFYVFKGFFVFYCFFRASFHVLVRLNITRLIAVNNFFNNFCR